MICSHRWLPSPADAASALALAGHTRCARCGKQATREDMQTLSTTLTTTDPHGQVLAEYDPFGQ